jgi:4-hydroxy-3-methylbut-2-enyl diphosphate reductase
VRIADRKVKKYAQEARTGGHILGQVVHNERVVEEMEQLGVHTVHGMGEVEGGTIIFSAHGVPPSFHDQARARGLNVLEHHLPVRLRHPRRGRGGARRGLAPGFVGDPEHREVIGYTNDLDPARYHVL